LRIRAMERRFYERITALLRVEFDCNNTICCGSVINLSEKGMLLKMQEIPFPLDNQFEILIPLKGEVLIAPVKVSRLVKTDNVYDGMGIELIDPLKKYSEFINNLKKNNL
jgi:hypothetical protein